MVKHFFSVCLDVRNISGSTMILGYLGVTAVSGYVYYLTWKKVRKDQIEMRSAKLALHPLLTAERDREYVSYRIVLCGTFLYSIYWSMQPQFLDMALTNNTARVVDKSAKGGLSSPFLITPASKAHVWFIPVRPCYLTAGEGLSIFLSCCSQLTIRSIYLT